MRHRATMWLELTRDESEERALSSPVLTDKREAISIANLEADVCKYLIATMCVDNFGGLNEQRHG